MRTQTSTQTIGFSGRPSSGTHLAPDFDDPAFRDKLLLPFDPRLLDPARLPRPANDDAGGASPVRCLFDLRCVDGPASLGVMSGFASGAPLPRFVFERVGYPVGEGGGEGSPGARITCSVAGSQTMPGRSSPFSSNHLRGTKSDSGQPSIAKALSKACNTASYVI